MSPAASVLTTPPLAPRSIPQSRRLLLRAPAFAALLHGAAMLGLSLSRHTQAAPELPLPETIEMTVEPAATSQPPLPPAANPDQAPIPAETIESSRVIPAPPILGPPAPTAPPMPSAPPEPQEAPAPLVATPAPERHALVIPRPSSPPVSRTATLSPRHAASTQAAPATPAELQAPTPSVPPAAPAPSTDAVISWRSALARWLQTHETYPDAARRDGVEGRVIVRFTLDGEGTVDAVAVVATSGSPLLDDAALAMLRGARLPAPPAGMPLTLTLPVRYSLAR